jgi:hypothetical protein
MNPGRMNEGQMSAVPRRAQKKPNHRMEICSPPWSNLSGNARPMLSGCQSFGPGSVARDRIEYSASISKSWKRQTLLNIVKLRFSTLPFSWMWDRSCPATRLKRDSRLAGVLRRPPLWAAARSRREAHWFWIADRDLKSKRTFAFIMMLFTLSETGEKENFPLITIPAK